MIKNNNRKYRTKMEERIFEAYTLTNAAKRKKDVELPNTIMKSLTYIEYSEDINTVHSS